ncbi:MAG: IS701 family transposase [Actinobacteria bacterium]|nr:IS701 family transposase [Actinomycetota bacterium]
MNQAERRQIERIGSWRKELDALHVRIAPRFKRKEVGARAGRYLSGLLEPVERRNGWQLAEATGERRPDGVQRLLNGARWDAGEVRDDLRAYVVEHFGDPGAVLVIDETGFLKKGSKSVGVSRQYSGTAGKVENCQIGVFLVYASARGRAFIDRALYLPEEEWAKDRSRREEAGVPEEVSFATKGALARAMLSRAFEAQTPASWVIADEVYGNDGKLRRWLESRGVSYVMAVSRSHSLPSIAGCRHAQEAVSEAPEEAWERLEVGEGSKGPRVYAWARARLPYECADGWSQWLLARCSVSDPQEIAYYRAYSPEGAPLSKLAKVAGVRWSIEECFERAKGEVGLDHYEVRRWEGWYRHVTLCLLAHAFLEVTRASANEGKGGSRRK